MGLEVFARSAEEAELDGVSQSQWIGDLIAAELVRRGRPLKSPQIHQPRSIARLARAGREKARRAKARRAARPARHQHDIDVLEGQP